MKKLLYLNLIVLALLPYCDRDRKNNSKSSEVMAVALQYAGQKFNKPKESVDREGIVTICEGEVNFIIPAENQIRYIISPSKIRTGLIDDDTREDAIITINAFRGQYEEMPECLILINNNGKLELNRVIESDMTIISIKDHIITAEVRTKSRNSPLRDCNACKEVVKYRFRTGDLVKVE